MKTYTDTRTVYQARFQAAQAEVADFQATGMLSSEAQQLLCKLPRITEIEDEKVRACVAIGNNYNCAFVAIGNAVSRHASNRREVDAFCGLWSGNSDHPPYKSNIRRLLLGPVLHRIREASDVTLTDFKRAIHWFFHQVKAAAVPTGASEHID